MTNQLPTTTLIRKKVYDILDGEREYQDKIFAGRTPPTLIEFTNLLIEYTDKLAASVVAKAGVSPSGGPGKRLREIAAIAVHAMELHGSEPRANHVPASAGITGTLHATAKLDTLAPAKSVGATGAVPAPSAFTAPATMQAPATVHTAPAAPQHSATPPAPPAHMPHGMVREETGVPYTTQHPHEEKK